MTSGRRAGATRRGIASRAGRPREPQRIGEVMSRLLARTGYARELSVAQYEEAWALAAGAEWARHSRPAILRRGILEVIVRNSTVLHELSFHKKEILAAMAKQLPNCPIENLRFRVGQMET